MKNKNTILLIFIFVVVCAFAFVYVLAKMTAENNRCINNPFTYAANTIIDEEGDFAYSVCSCNLVDKRITFYFDVDGLYVNNPLFNYPLDV